MGFGLLVVSSDRRLHDWAAGMPEHTMCTVRDTSPPTNKFLTPDCFARSDAPGRACFGLSLAPARPEEILDLGGENVKIVEKIVRCARR